MKKIVLILSCLLMMGLSLQAQKYFTRTGTISFFSDAPMEKIEAINNKVTSVIDLESGKMEFAVLIKAFLFEKALMQEHFNENYMESDQFPKSTFKGQVQNLDSIDFSKDGIYAAKVKGVLTIHGESKELETEGTFNVADGKISATSKFELSVADFNISIPSVVKDNIAKTVEVKLHADFEEFKKPVK